MILLRESESISLLIAGIDHILGLFDLFFIRYYLE